MINVTMSGNEGMAASMSGNDEMSVWMSEATVVDTRNHNELNNLDYGDQHPMSAITGLVSALENKADTDDIPTKTSELTNDSGFLTEHQSLSAYRTASAQDIIDQTNASASDLTAHISNEVIHVTANQKTTWDNKQDAINDLTTIRSGASAGATAVQPSAISDMASKTWVGSQGYLTEHQSLSGYATETWVGQQGFLTAHQDISGKEDKTNKITSLSDQSTDTQYPSAKCVYDIVGDIESTLQAIRGVS